MKILYVIEDMYPPFRVDVVELFAKCISSNGFEIDWLMRREIDKIGTENTVNWYGQRVFLFNVKTSKGLLGKIAKNIKGIFFDLKIITIALKRKYDIIQVRDRYLAGVIACCISKITGARYVFWMSYPYPESKIDQAKNRYVQYPALTYIKGLISKIILYKMVLPLSDHIFVQSDEMLNRISKKGISKDRMTAIPMGVKDEVLEFDQPQVQLNTNAPSLLYLGGISRIRKTEILIEVLHKVKTRFPKSTLVYVGNGLSKIDNDLVLKEAKRLGLIESVSITGNLTIEKAWDYVKRSDICLSPINPIPALLQASPTKLIEYMAFSKPIVANDHPEQSKILAESGVGKTVPWDSESFAGRIIEMLENPEATLRKASLGRKYVQKNRVYSVISEKVIGQYEKLGCLK